MADLGTFDFPDEQLPSRSQHLPTFIPVMRPGKHVTWTLPDWVAIQLSDILHTDGSIRDHLSVRRSLGLSSAQRILVNCQVKDSFLQTVWVYRDRFVQSLRTAGYDSILAPAFSVWDSHYRFEHLVALSQSFVLFGLMSAEGVATIPSVSGFTANDWKRAGLWLAGQPEVSTATVDLQRSRKKRDWLEQMAALEILRINANRQVKWIVTGVSNPIRIREVASVLRDVTVINSDVYMRAVQGRRPWPAKGASRSNLSKADIFAESLGNISGFVRAVTRGSDSRHLLRSPDRRWNASAREEAKRCRTHTSQSPLVASG